jgi:hypothetical protein
MTEEVGKQTTQEDVAKIERDSSEAVQRKPEEVRAESYGWKPKDKWVEDGNAEEDWVPAKHFLKFGEVKQQLISKDKQLTKQEKIIKMMKNHHTSVKELAVQEAVAKLKAERNAALEENDLVRAEQLRDKIEETKEKAVKQKALPAEIEKELQDDPKDDGPPPEYFEFLDENPWYNAKKPDEMTKEADKIGWAERVAAESEGKAITPKEIYKAVAVKIRKLYPEKFSTPKSPQSDSPSKSSGERGSSGVKLTEEQLAIAKNSGLSPEKYAEELKGYRGK